MPSSPSLLAPLALALAALSAALASEPGEARAGDTRAEEDAALRAALREEGARAGADPLNNGGLLIGISRALARLGDLEGATAAAAPLEEYPLAETRLEVAAALARRGDAEGAARAASLAGRGAPEALLAAARASRDRDAAEALVARARSAAFRASPGACAEGLVAIALYRRERGEDAAARALLPEAESRVPFERDALARCDALARIGVAYARLGDATAARDAFARAVSASAAHDGERFAAANRDGRVHVVAVAEAEAGLVDEAAALARTLPDSVYSSFERDRALHDIARARIDAGDLAGASRVVLASTLEVNGWRDALLAEIAGALARRGDLAAAETLTARIDGPTRRAQAVLERCAALSRLGRSEEAYALADTTSFLRSSPPEGLAPGEAAEVFLWSVPATWLVAYEESRWAGTMLSSHVHEEAVGDLAAAALRFQIARRGGPVDEAALTPPFFAEPFVRLCAARAAEGDVRGALAWARRWRRADQEDGWPVTGERAAAVLAVAEARLAGRAP